MLLLLLAPGCDSCRQGGVRAPLPSRDESPAGGLVVGTAEPAADHSAWSRPAWEPGGGDALVLYVVYGEFDDPLAVAAPRYRVDELPEGVTVTRHARGDPAGTHARWLTGAFGELFAERAPALHDQAAAAPQAIEITGRVADPPDLLYLRRTIGVVTYLLDHGGVAVADPQALGFFGPTEFRRRAFDSDQPAPARHVATVVSEDPDAPARLFVHTRGMRKFGRPDVAVRRVPESFRPRVLELVQGLVTAQAHGVVVRDGQAFAERGLPEGLVARRLGSLDEPTFNNVRLELSWPD